MNLANHEFGSGSAIFVIVGSETLGDCVPGDVHHQNRFGHGSQGLSVGSAEGFLEQQSVNCAVIVAASLGEAAIA